KFESDILPSEFTKALIQGNGTLSYQIDVLSLEYNASAWTLTGEYMRGKNVTRLKGNIFPTLVERPGSSYLQFTYHDDNRLDYFVRYEDQRADRNDPNGKGFVDAVFIPLQPFLSVLQVTPSPYHSRYSFDKTIGLAWKPSADFMLRAEWHHVIGTSEVANYLFNKKTLTKEWDLIAVQLSYRFK
ncbi:MAG TPA: hypothetical protein VFM46_19410, partial [Pseudomonadales bacterium]|nr:hypothetical protein [Pseudomonadales bacterium]